MLFPNAIDQHVTVANTKIALLREANDRYGVVVQSKDDLWCLPVYTNESKARAAYQSLKAAILKAEYE